MIDSLYFNLFKLLNQFNYENIGTILSELNFYQQTIIKLTNEWRYSQPSTIITGCTDYSILIKLKNCNNLIIGFYLDILKWNNPIIQCYHADVKKQIILLYQNAFIVIQQPYSNILKQDPLTIITNSKFIVKFWILTDYIV